ncbi:origin recognition complex subunit 4-like [Gigantopelta aegis]|uniref:origin recognition complex subunit 4-like n=1 Tax=Gigantopelta aegis TaxID=1735272 RepID=UPI001B88918E|nr:origin recognition complex subunit 4-like [Gigantopelta aegis]XP_041354936.1 origin recognition complex subunit 4-like [Gigantopelta aegis]
MTKRRTKSTVEKESSLLSDEVQDESPIGLVQDESPIGLVQDELRARLTQTVLRTQINGLVQEKKQLYDLIHRTASCGESNSALVIGPRGSGKTMVLKTVITEIAADETIQQNLLTVRLNGLLQTDDRIALKEITRQLQLENTLGDKVFGTFAETLQFLLEALKSGNNHSTKPILFILDEFDLFAHHRNQTLLYNLFDVSQSAQTPVCVIGLTCRLDVIELLEKRVKSRFSHRQIHLFNALSFHDYCHICRATLSLPHQFPDDKFAKRWNHQIEELVDEVNVRDVLRRQFNLNKDIRGLHSLLTWPICQLSPSHPRLKAADFLDSFKMITVDSKSSILHGVSILELCLIIAMKHITDVYDGEPFNFEMVYSEYMKFAQKKSSIQVFEKPVVLKAFEHLIALELIRTMDGGGTRVQKEFRMMDLLIHNSQILDALQSYPDCPTEVKQWASCAVV